MKQLGIESLYRQLRLIGIERQFADHVVALSMPTPAAAEDAEAAGNAENTASHS